MRSHNQLELILNVLGTPTIDEFYAITSRRSKEYIRSLPFRKKIPFKQLYPHASDEAIDFLNHTLTCEFLGFPNIYIPASSTPSSRPSPLLIRDDELMCSRPTKEVHSRRMPIPSLPPGLPWSRGRTCRSTFIGRLLWIRLPEGSCWEGRVEEIIVWWNHEFQARPLD